jgi:hypothetical protein
MVAGNDCLFLNGKELFVNYTMLWAKTDFWMEVHSFGMLNDF